MFKDYWKKAVESFQQYSHPIPPQQFEDTMRAIVLSFVEDSLRQASVDTTAKVEIKKNVDKILRSDGSQLQNLPQKYSELYREFDRMKDIRKQEMLADYHERIRYLVFRMLTAIGIAAVVLGTGYLAHRWGIPLPLIRLPT